VQPRVQHVHNPRLTHLKSIGIAGLGMASITASGFVPEGSFARGALRGGTLYFFTVAFMEKAKITNPTAEHRITLIQTTISIVVLLTGAFLYALAHSHL